MSYLGIESFAEFVGGGGDYQFDRIPMEWSRYSGVEDETLEAGAEESESETYTAEKVNLSM